MWTADYKLTGRVHMENGVLVDHIGRYNPWNQVFDYVFPDLLLAHSLVVLG